MENTKLTFKFTNKEETYTFENKVCEVNEKKLVQELARPNIKNEDSLLVIESLDNLQISDVIQLKINVEDTGVFLASFKKDELDENTRNEMIEDIKKLKDKVEPTKETQLAKIKKLLKSLSAFNPIYVTFSNKGPITISYDDLSKIKVNFPLLILKDIHKPLFKKAKSEKPAKIGKVEIDFPLFDIEYIFVVIFPLLGTFGIFGGVFEIFNKETLAAFMLALGIIFAFVTYVCIYKILYRRNVEKYKGLRYYLIPFIVVGIGLGLLAGYLVSYNLLEPKNNLNNGLIWLISIVASLPICIGSIPASRLINSISIKLKK